MPVRVAICCVVAHLLLLGCGAMRPPEPYETVRPQTPPVRNSTSFTEALRCMDTLFTAHGRGSQGNGALYVTSRGTIDKTNKNIGGDNLDPMISSISRMSTHSGTFKFVGYNPHTLRTLEELRIIEIIHGNKLGKVIWPRYEIIAAICSEASGHPNDAARDAAAVCGQRAACIVGAGVAGCLSLLLLS